MKTLLLYYSTVVLWISAVVRGWSFSFSFLLIKLNYRAKDEHEPIVYTVLILHSDLHLSLSALYQRESTSFSTVLLSVKWESLQPCCCREQQQSNSYAGSYMWMWCDSYACDMFCHGYLASWHLLVPRLTASVMGTQLLCSISGNYLHCSAIDSVAWNLNIEHSEVYHPSCVSLLFSSPFFSSLLSQLVILVSDSLTLEHSLSDINSEKWQETNQTTFLAYQRKISLDVSCLD